MTPPAATDRTLRVLIVGADRSLEDEFINALAGVPDTHGVVYYAETSRQALETARGRQPDLVVLDIGRDVSDLVQLSSELQELVPAAVIAGAYRTDRFEGGQFEGTSIIELLRAQVRDFLRRPLSATELRAVLGRLMSSSPTSAPVERGRVASFVSNKGGVGKSTLSVNVACALALRHPDDVLLIDASLQGGSCAMLLDLKASTSIADVVRERDRVDATLLRHLTLKHGTGLRVLAAPADALEGAEVDDEAIGRILHLARRSFSYVIVDTFPMIDSVVTTILDLTDVAFVVIQGTAPAVAGTARLLPVLEGLGLPASRQRLVLSYNYKPFLGNLRPADISDRLQRTIDYVAPYDKRVLVTTNTGRPHIIDASWWQPFKKMVDRIVDDLDAAAASGSKESLPLQMSDESRSRFVEERAGGARFSSKQAG